MHPQIHYYHKPAFNWMTQLIENFEKKSFHIPTKMTYC